MMKCLQLNVTLRTSNWPCLAAAGRWPKLSRMPKTLLFAASHLNQFNCQYRKRKSLKTMYPRQNLHGQTPDKRKYGTRLNIYSSAANLTCLFSPKAQRPWHLVAMLHDLYSEATLGRNTSEAIESFSHLNLKPAYVPPVEILNLYRKQRV